LRESVSERKPIVWKALSVDDSVGQARIVFKSRKNLHAALGNGVIRRKLIRFLRDQFRWGNSEEIEIYDDFVPYSFFFREIKDGKAGISGGLILHGQEDMEKALSKGDYIAAGRINEKMNAIKKRSAGGRRW